MGSFWNRANTKLMSNVTTNIPHAEAMAMSPRDHPEHCRNQYKITSRLLSIRHQHYLGTSNLTGPNHNPSGAVNATSEAAAAYRRRRFE